MNAANRFIRLLSNGRLLTLLLTAAVLVIYTGVYTTPLTAQTLISGDVVGTVTDPSGAVVPNATVNIKSNDTGQTNTTTTNAQGGYRFSLLKPGGYTLTYSAANFQGASRQVNVGVGQATTANVQLALSSATQTVNVTSEAPIVETENGNVSTTFTQNQVALVPNPGNDLSYVAQTAPGATMNTQGGYGNFSTFGISATSNLFTFNGQYENDPFLNLNNSGATNLLLGNNDVREATVVNNGYTGQYGGLAGANVNYVSKSGTNAWHGNAVYWWNGRALNANEYFNKSSEVTSGLANTRPFVNDNQWAASIGGPLIHDKTFFFVDTEGIRVVLPTSQPVNIPSPQFQAATLANLAAVGQGAQVPFYQQMFNLYNTAKGAQNAVPATGGGCGDFTGLGGAPCASTFQSTAGQFSPEWLLTARVDQNIGSKDRAFIHFRTDHGVQATYTDPISPVFNAVSTQPQWEGQFNETHTFGPNTVNQFILSGSWYSAIFSADMPKATAAMPFAMRFTGSAFNTLGGALYDWPQGRNVTQYQIVDDVSHTKGRNNFKFGINFKRNDVTNYDNGLFTTGRTLRTSLTDFFNGTAAGFVQNFAQDLKTPEALYNLGFYGQDEIRVSPRFSVTLAMRLDHNSNPVCNNNCFANLTAPWETISHDPSIPYNQAIQTGLGSLFQGINRPVFDYEPRIGFALSPFGSNHGTVLRGGIGMFADAFPAFIVDNLQANSPLVNGFITGPVAVSPNVAGNGPATAAAANAALLSAFNSGGTFASISAANPLFSAPSFYTLAHSIKDPMYYEWNLELEQPFGTKTALDINYVGNHGTHELIQNGGLNAFCDLPSASAFCGLSPTGFAGLPTAPPDQRFSTVTSAQTIGVSNYNGVTVSLKERWTSFQIQANYTYSHALDEISNGGLLPFNFGSVTGGFGVNGDGSILNPINPFNIRANYGNSDYDVRHYFSLNYVFNSPDRYGPHGVLGGWILAGTLFARTGLPFSVVDTATAGALEGANWGIASTAGGVNVLADVIGPQPLSCGTITGAPTATPCLNASNFSAPGTLTSFGNQRRNQFRGPGFLDTDINVMKNFHIPHWEGGTLGVGATIFNLLNHPNFNMPVADVANQQFGSVVSTVNPPTTPYGAFLGSAASMRIIQLNARLQF